MADPTTVLYEYLDRCNREEVATYRPRGRRFNPSSIDRCERAIFYKHSGVVPRVVPGFVSLYGQDGDICHDSVRWLLKKAGVLLKGLDFDEESGEIKETMYFRKKVMHKGVEVEVSGRADGLIFHDDYAEWMPLEIKSLDGFKYQYIQRAYQKGELHDYLLNGNKGRYAKWYMQTTLTSKLLGYDKTYFLLKDRSMCQIGLYDKVNDLREGFVLDVDDALYERMLDKMVRVTAQVDSGEPTPLMLCPLEGSYECGICDFNHICREKKKGADDESSST